MSPADVQRHTAGGVQDDAEHVGVAGETLRGEVGDRADQCSHGGSAHPGHGYLSPTASNRRCGAGTASAGELTQPFAGEAVPCTFAILANVPGDNACG